MTTDASRPRAGIPLLWKLMGIHVLILVVVIGVIWVAVEHSAGNYFMQIMREYDIDPVMPHQMFLHATRATLIWSSVGAVLMALAASLVLTRRLLRPIRRMGRVAARIAAGDYSQRVDAARGDEVGELVAAFNQMVSSLQRVEKLRKDLVADVAHELRTPLTNIRGYLEALCDGVLPPSPQQIASLHEEVLRLVRLVDGLHQLAVADAGSQRLRLESVDLAELVDQSIAPFRPRMAAKGISLEEPSRRDACPTRVDPDRFVQVLNNLFENALDYTPTGGHVAVQLLRDSASVTLRVVNSGEGIPSHDIPLIFERFYRGEKSRSREHGGAGIGLSLVKQIVEAHGGRVSVESGEDLTTFHVVVPRSASPEGR